MEEERKKETEERNRQFAADIERKEKEHKKNIDAMHEQLQNTKAETAAEQLKLKKEFNEELAISNLFNVISKINRYFELVVK